MIHPVSADCPGLFMSSAQQFETKAELGCGFLSHSVRCFALLWQASGRLEMALYASARVVSDDPTSESLVEGHIEVARLSF